MTSKKYIEKLKDPRWQKMRLKILERDSWMCTSCQEEGECLHVHHNRYVRGKDPWEYDECDLRTLCESCHKEESELRKSAEDLLLSALRQAGFDWMDVDTLACALGSFPHSPCLQEPAIAVIDFALRTRFEETCEQYFAYLKERCKCNAKKKEV